MQISSEGKIGIALALIALAGSGAIVIAPNQVSIGWGMIAVAVVGCILLVLHHFEVVWRRMIPTARMPLLSLLSEAKMRGWVFSGDRDALYNFTQGLRQAASEGAVAVWGVDVKRGTDLESAPSIYVTEKIEPSYFKLHWIDTHQGWVHNKNTYMTTSLPSGNEQHSYCDLQLDREQALAWLSREGDRLRNSGSQ